ncbi:MAG: hypothetical protein RMI01_08475, partial [Thermodesulfovibrio sp.]|nr:hypothetical protein [Thermodesulfovibrio sp.]
REKQLPNGINFINALPITLLFDRRGYPLNSACGFGAETIRLKNTNNTQKSVVVSRYGRIRVE